MSTDFPLCQSGWWKDHKQVDGVDLKPRMKAKHSNAIPSTGTILTTAIKAIPSGAIRVGDWKLVERYEDGRVHLYNLKDDIGEKTTSGQHPKIVKSMRAKLHAWYGKLTQVSPEKERSEGRALATVIKVSTQAAVISSQASAKPYSKPTKTKTLIRNSRLQRAEQRGSIAK